MDFCQNAKMNVEEREVTYDSVILIYQPYLLLCPLVMSFIFCDKDELWHF